jgi:tRNA (guanine-N7-)-methyltransferase
MPVDPYERAPRLPDGPIDPLALFLPASEPTVATPGPVLSPIASGVVPPRPRVELEIGPGRGWFIVERLEIDPSVKLLGLEIRRKWATIVDERLIKRGHAARARVFAEDAKQALPRFLPASLDVVYLHFPDPWWKKRHQKRLVLASDLLQELGRVIVPGGELFVQTDVAERADEYQELLDAAPDFEPASDSARIEDHAYGARSPRERKAIEDGLPIFRLLYRRKR